MKTDDTGARKTVDRELKRGSIPSSQPTCKNCSYLCAVCTIIIVHNTMTQETVLLHIPLPPDQHHISDVAKWR